MKTLIRTSGFLLIATSLAVAACNDDSKSSTTTSGSDTTTTVASDKKMSSDSGSATKTDAMSNDNADRDVINYAVPKNATEMAWLMAGMKMGTSKELKEHARMMLADHKKMDGEVATLAAKKGWALPAKDTANAVNLTEKMGKDWDKAWTDKMIAEHTEIVDRFTKAKDDVKDADLKALLTKSIPVVQSHLDMAKAMKDKMK